MKTKIFNIPKEDMMQHHTFADAAIVACGTMRPEIDHLAAEKFIDTDQIYYTTPGLHQDVRELERQLSRAIEKAKTRAKGVIVVYGGKYCYVNPDEPTRLMGSVVSEHGPNVARIQASHCMGMLASQEEMDNIVQEIVGGEPVWFMTPVWIKYQKLVFKGWDKGIANENFPRHTGGAVILDGIGFMDDYMASDPEGFLDYCDWMGIPMQAYPISLDRFKNRLTEQLSVLHQQQ